jgi:hypothetical protein
MKTRQILPLMVGLSLVAGATGTYAAADLGAPQLLNNNSAAIDDDAPVRSRDGSIIFISHASNNTIQWQNGPNALDVPRKFRCRSVNGCVVMFSAMVVLFVDGDYAICGFVDAHSASPSCGNQSPEVQPAFSRQRRIVSQGIHTVYTQVLVTDSSQQEVFSWETDYTIYERGP